MTADEYLAQKGAEKKPTPAPGSAAEMLAQGAAATAAEQAAPDRDPRKVEGKV